jgi:hypothetical protein
MSTDQKTPRKNTRNPLLIGRERGVWYPDLVGQIPGYAATEEGYRRRQAAAREQVRVLNASGQRGTRVGLPDGFAKRRDEVEEIKEEARRAAREAVGVLLEHGAIGMPAPASDAADHRDRVEAAFAKSIDRTVADRDRLRAMKVVLGLLPPEKVKKLKVG